MKATKLCAYFFPSGYKTEAFALLQLAWPAVCTALLLCSLLVINVLMCGRFGVTAMNAVSLGNSILIVLGIDFGTGLATACDTLFSQAFGGNGKKRMGTLLQRSFFVMFMFVFPLASLYVNMEPLLILAGQDPEVSWNCAKYLTLAIPALFCYYAFLILARYMQTQNCMLPVLFVALGGNLLSVLINYISLYVLQLDYTISAVSFDLAILCMAFGSLLFVWLSKFYKPTWSGWSRSALLEIGEFLKLGVSGVLIVALESWWIQATVLLAGIMGVHELGAQSIIMQYEALTYTFSEGLAVAVGVRVGQHAGAGDVDGAWTTMWAGLSFVPVIGTLIGVLYIALADYLPWLFVNDAEVAAIASATLPIVAGVQFIDLVVNALVGTLRGLGKQHVGVVVCFVGTYLVNMPIVLLLVFRANMSVAGIWTGFLAGGSVMLTIYLVYFFRLNWTKACETSEASSTFRRRSSVLSYSYNLLHQHLLPSSPDLHNAEADKEQGRVNAETPLLDAGKCSRSKFRLAVIRGVVIYDVALIVFCLALVYQFVFYSHDHSCPTHSHCSNESYSSDGNYSLTSTVELAAITVSYA